MCWNCRNNTGRPHRGGRGRLSKAKEAEITKRIAEKRQAETTTVTCLLCEREFVTIDASWPFCRKDDCKENETPASEEKRARVMAWVVS